MRRSSSHGDARTCADEDWTGWLRIGSLWAANALMPAYPSLAPRLPVADSDVSGPRSCRPHHPRARPAGCSIARAGASDRGGSAPGSGARGEPGAEHRCRTRGYRARARNLARAARGRRRWRGDGCGGHSSPLSDALRRWPEHDGRVCRSDAGGCRVNRIGRGGVWCPDWGRDSTAAATRLRALLLAARFGKHGDAVCGPGRSQHLGRR